MGGRRFLFALLGVSLASSTAMAQFSDVPEPRRLDSRAAADSGAPKASKPGAQAAVSEHQAPAEPAGLPAKQLFGAANSPSAAVETRAIGGYARGCLAGAKALPMDGPAWQVMRLSRNRNWGHPELVSVLERLATDVKAQDGWTGLLIGDLSQPRGGPMLSGHASHQIGLDADIWLRPMPNRRLSAKEREEISATSMVMADKLSVDLKQWTAAHVALVRRAASYPQVERILVNPAIKKALCLAAGAGPHEWLAKVRPYSGHDDHLHIRIACPKGSADCVPQTPTTGDDGCGKEVEDWLKLVTAPPVPGPPEKPKPPLTIEQLPQGCRLVLAAPPAIGAEPAVRTAAP